MQPEDEARQKIDRQLTECGWTVQDFRAMNISAGPGVAIRHFPLKTGEADYLLYADGRTIGVVEAELLIDTSLRRATRLRQSILK